MSTQGNDITNKLFLFRHGKATAVIKGVDSLKQLFRFIMTKFNLVHEQIDFLYYIDDEGDSIRLETDRDIGTMLSDNHMTKMILINIQLSSNKQCDPNYFKEDYVCN